ncbi:MAG: S41 family peptidase [Clostridia bacterium]|nr:S41 family peptidase [Clostridia bacterium]
MKKLLCILLILMMIPWAAAAEDAPANQYVLEGKTYPHLRAFSNEEPPKESEITLYSVDGGDIPYISLADFMTFLAELEKDRAEWDVTYNILPGENGMFLVTRPDNDSRMLVNAQEDLLFFTNFDLFTSMPDSVSLVSIIDLPQPKTLSLDEKVNLIMKRVEEGNPMTEEEIAQFMNEGVEPTEDLFTLGSIAYSRTGSAVSMNLKDYNIDIIAQDGACFIPFQTLNDIFIPPLYMTYVFNGQALIGAEWGSDFVHRMYDAEPQAMSEELAAFNFRELCFNLDHFYGLREEHEIGNFAEMLVQNYDLFSQMTSTDPAVFDSALNKLTATFLDDGHSGFKKYSWRSGSKTGAELAKLLANAGASAMIRLGNGFRMQAKRKAAYPDAIPQYEEIGDTAFITFDSFTAKRPHTEDYYHLENPDDPQDTIELIIYANRQIRREGSPVKNIVIDLSMNGGGTASAAVFAVAWFTGSAIIDLRNPLTGAQSIVFYRADVNLNGLTTTDPSDSVSTGGYNLYCLISAQSFSCGNLLPACFKASGNVTLIGQQSGGGSCVVRPCTTASGSIFQMSGTKQLSTVINGSFYNIDQGIEPDIRLTKSDSFYDRPSLVELIHNTK